MVALGGPELGAIGAIVALTAGAVLGTSGRKVGPRPPTSRGSAALHRAGSGRAGPMRPPVRSRSPADSPTDSFAR